MANMPNLKKKYQEEVAPALMQKFGYKSVMQIPKLDKIVVNCGCGEARDNAKVLEAVVGDLTKITGQKAIVTKAKKSVANFKLREGMPIGAKVTLRGERMYEFCLLYTSQEICKHRRRRGLLCEKSKPRRHCEKRRRSQGRDRAQCPWPAP